MAYKPSKFEMKIYIAVLLALSVGIILSIQQSNWQWFERSGSLIIMIALAALVNEKVAFAAGIVEAQNKKISALQERLKSNKNIGLKNVDLYEDLNETEKLGKFASLAVTNFEKRIRRIEIAVIFFGTFIWGYGAPIANLIWPLN